MGTKNLEAQLIDKRVVQKNIEKKRLSQKEYQSYLESLKDDNENCEALDLDEETT